MSEKMVARVEIARPDGLMEELPAYVVRDGLAIHDAMPGQEAPIWYAITATGCGYRLGLFDRMENAERAFRELAPLAPWASAQPDDVQRLREKVTQIIADCGDVRHRTACE